MKYHQSSSEAEHESREMTQSKPHICFVSDTIHAYFGSDMKRGVGGAERQQYLIARSLRERGFPVSVITLDHNNESPDIIDGLKIWREIPDKRGSLNAPQKLITLFKIFWKVDADVYYVRGNDFLCIATSIFCQLTNHKFIYAIANDSDIEPTHLERRNPLFTKLFLSSIANADAVSVLTPHQKEVLKTAHGIDSTVVPCGYDLPPENDILDHGNRDFVLWVGRLDQDQKKPEKFLNLAMENPDIPFVMIGPPDNDDQDRAYFSSVKEKANTIDNLKFFEFIPPNEIHKFFRKASLLVNTSEYEGFGNVFLEAWRYATPVVTLNYTLHGVIEEQPVGIHACSMEHLSEAIQFLHQNPMDRESMGHAGRKLVQREYSIEEVTNKMVEIITKP